MPREDQIRLFDTKRAARILGVSPATLVEWRNRRACGPPFVQLNGPRSHVRYAFSDLLAYVVKCTVKPEHALVSRRAHQQARLAKEKAFPPLAEIRC